MNTAYKLTDNIYWVGAIDWNVRNFHGYLTHKGSSYNAYLIIDKKITLIDTVKDPFTNEMLERISTIIDPSKIDTIISNHVEMDHSGSLDYLLTNICPKAKIYATPTGVTGLKEHYKKNWHFRPVKTGDTLSLGKRTIKFIETKMIHWPDNMLAYLQEEAILFSNDSFGQHIASIQRIDSEFDLSFMMFEAQKYYANIVLPYGRQVQSAIKAVEDIPLKLIAPSHGIMWKQHIPSIIEKYSEWMINKTKNKAVIIYDTMWKSTEIIALNLLNFFINNNIEAQIFNLQHCHISDIMTEVIDAKYICVGSSTLNNNMLPTVASFLIYLKGLYPKERIGLAFGSYGWSGQSIGQIEDVFNELKYKTLPSIRIKYIPDKENIDLCLEKIQNTLIN
jgi:flavorubredoxin